MSQEAPDNKETILVVDDDKWLRNVSSRFLSKLGYNVITVEDGNTAREIFEEASKNIDLAIIDMFMPGINGPTTYAFLKEIKHDLPVIFITGLDTHDLILGEEVTAKKHMKVLQKPYDLKKLQQTIHQLLEPSE